MGGLKSDPLKLFLLQYSIFFMFNQEQSDFIYNAPYYVTDVCVCFYNLVGDTLLISTQRGPCVVGRDVV